MLAIYERKVLNLDVFISIFNKINENSRSK